MSSKNHEENGSKYDLELQNFFPLIAMCFVSYKKLAQRRKSSINIGLSKVAQTMSDCGGDRKWNQCDGHFKEHREIREGSSREWP
jgi:hypothetical protein